MTHYERPMNSSDRSENWKKIESTIRQLWPKNELNDSQLEQWRDALSHIRYEVALRALQMHFRETHWRNPQLAQVLRHTQTVAERKDVDHKYLENLAKQEEHDKYVIESRIRINRGLAAMPLEDIRKWRDHVNAMLSSSFLKRNLTERGFRPDGYVIRAATKVEDRNLSDNPDDWTEMRRGLVWAAWWRYEHPDEDAA